jgi:hypothetical protein
VVLILNLTLKKFSVLGDAPALSSSKTDALALTSHVWIVIRYRQISDPFIL